MISPLVPTVSLRQHVKFSTLLILVLKTRLLQISRVYLSSFLKKNHLFNFNTVITWPYISLSYTILTMTFKHEANQVTSAGVVCFKFLPSKFTRVPFYYNTYAKPKHTSKFKIRIKSPTLN